MIDGRLSAKDYEVTPIAAKDGREFIVNYHYSKGCSHTCVYMHGLFKIGDSKLLGVAQWLPPTRRAAESVNRENWKRVLSLTRLAVHPNVPQNGASFLMARSMKIIKNEGKWVSLVTYADEFMNHTGQIYKATNWTYVGFMNPTPRWEDANGKQVAKLSTRSRTSEEMRELGFRMVGRFRKHKFVKHLQIKSVEKST
jgi:hypothetical protein